MRPVIIRMWDLNEAPDDQIIDTDACILSDKTAVSVDELGITFYYFNRSIGEDEEVLEYSETKRFELLADRNNFPAINVMELATMTIADLAEYLR
ncbi:hypothetical protein [Lederbergia citri]|uniref:Uncharacterized protein n=1 Tax=Lederbergia citri TaxID=2833580 RepID=A0A942YGG0_9BACI|nr:hypothetical protein [Lederbergia citri]MBS4193476.1 hypothetical protein [Lederbergia citri]